jgi:hypothetical protein
MDGDRGRKNLQDSGSPANLFQPYLDTKCRLGEGPFYNEQRNELRFVVGLSKSLISGFVAVLNAVSNFRTLRGQNFTLWISPKVPIH